MVTKTNVADALVYARECMHVISLVLCDLKMSRNGHKLPEQFRKIDGAEYVPLVALTSHAWMFNRNKSAQSGFDGFIEKTSSFDNLVPQVRAFVRP